MEEAGRGLPNTPAGVCSLCSPKRTGCCVPVPPVCSPGQAGCCVFSVFSRSPAAVCL